MKNSNNGYIYINPDTNDCVQTCPSSLKSFEELATFSDGATKMYLCKSICKEEEFRYGDECVKFCPNGYFIGFNNVCKQSCLEDSNGKYYYQINEVSISPPGYTIYKCIRKSIIIIFCS